jgi:hypothetical protein
LIATFYLLSLHYIFFKYNDVITNEGGKKMIKLHAGAAIDDHMLRHAIDKKTMEGRIRRELANKMVDELLNNTDFSA